MKNDNPTPWSGPAYMPDGQPVPELMTEDELIKFLRLDIDGPAHPGQTLQYYRDKGLLRATRVGKRLRYQRKEALEFLDRLTDYTQKNVS